jgi:hypothetical protein
MVRDNGAAFKLKRERDDTVTVSFTKYERKLLENEAAKRHAIQGQSSQHYHRTGVFGEAAAMRALGLPLSFCHESDCGTDFLLGNVEVDVKCSNGLPHKSNLIFDSFDKFIADIAIQTRIAFNNNALLQVEVIGWITKDDFKLKAEMVPMRKSKKPLLKRHLLRPIQELQHGLDEILITGGTLNASTSAANKPASVHRLSPS